MVQRIFLASVSALFSAAIAGCGGADNVGQVSGKVTLGGEPLAGAIVKFQPTAGGSPSAAIVDGSGNYKLGYTEGVQGAEIGSHKVIISTFSAGNPDAEPPKPPVAEKVPSKYNAKSELTADVKAGSNTIDFPLEPGGEIVPGNK